MTTLSTKPPSFRRDINGLRAWAVVAVILYHFGIPGFDGGFVGVDIFFVISGFLMTGIIIGGIEHSGGGNRFSLLNFYLARARRIVPALLVLCTVLLILGWFWLPATDYRALGFHIFSALGFVSNIKFWKEAGYFDAASHEKWLLHTWSLSVEWQFYIILPLVLLLLWKLRPGRNFIISMMSVGFVLSLGLSIVLSPTKASAAFYLLPTRAWEMLAGGLVYLLADRIRLSYIQSKLLEAVGFLLLLYSIFFLTTAAVWPGYLALLPVIGTALVLSVNQESKLTATPPAQWLGNTSYSLYLWHWPFAVALNYAGLQQNLFAVAIALFLTLVTGYASYKLVEKPVRFHLNKVSLKPSIIGFAVVVLAVALPGLVVRLQDGVPGRLPSDIDAIFAEANNKNPRMGECHVSNSTPVPECTYGGKKLGAIVIGDSHAASVVRSVEKALPSKELGVLDWTLSSCTTILGIKHTTNKDFKCADFLEKALNKLQNEKEKENIPIIIVNRISTVFEGAQDLHLNEEEKQLQKYINIPPNAKDERFYDEMTSGLVETACALSKYNDVYMTRPIPELNLHVPNTMGRNSLYYSKNLRVSISIEEYNERHQRALNAQDIAARNCGIKILDPLPYLCDDNNCYGDHNGLPVYYDDDHLNERGGQLLIPMFEEVFKEIKSEATLASKS
ncbi:acyltransferase family protein [Oceanimonas sp. CHS3-5]|uniref:acyltransferase family protein n=1 Tax=Oceanimonas sp. CHS3-5 TaxID=3068186 RepID=UPI00273E5490|nr:acyltransferase family protein [Oceanimonas sp. CHS3-5]MDP5291686.1 acyltransferase family protein [Oceanimonas sp. CHS3-5]